MDTPDENGFLKRGLLLLGAMVALSAVVLSMIFFKPEMPVSVDTKSLPGDPSPKGWEVRYNATVALLRRGSDKVPWPIVREMLDEKQQLKNCQRTLDNGQEVIEETNARRFIIQALKALSDWKTKIGDRAADAPLDSLRTQVDVLAKSSIPELRMQAESTRQAIK